MKEITLAYLAGLIDGEAYVGIKKTKPKDAISPIYHERFQCRMVHKGSLKLLAETLGGSYYLESSQTAEGRRPLYCWQASDAIAAKIAYTLLPYLVIKRPNAMLLLALRKSKEDPRARKRGSPAKRVMNPAVLAFRDQIYIQCKALNHAPI